MAVQVTTSAYSVYWVAKFEDIDGDTLVMFNRLYSKFQRMQEKYVEDDLKFVIGASEYDTNKHVGWTLKMVYPTAKKKGGRKVCMAFAKVNYVKDGRRIQGTLVDVVPKTKPHIHIMVIGHRASLHAQDIARYLTTQEKKSGKEITKKRKKKLPDSHAISNSRGYIEGQSTHFRDF